MYGRVRWVLWDVKDTLLRVRKSVGEQYCQEARRVGLNVPAAEIESAFRCAYRQHSRLYPNYGMVQGLGGQAWWAGVVQNTFSQCGVFPDSEKALQGCVSLGLQLGVVSNFDNRLEGILRGCGMLSYFSFLLTSEMAGVAKPDPAIFQLALQRCGVAATSVAHIGDHYTNDFRTARSLGIHGYLIDRKGDTRPPEVPTQYRLCSLDELPMRLQQDTH
ncbi:haloacid dehalogenase-like hydrolase domain-containing protein 3 isoform X2 [Conger conger]|uniref:haloacid dehalogenase-like hydrolase domain-containing protein 3 isoform X2 n=1 Tax=Conger conger TaxID=82655 RepID=UPI002A5AE283|nr:haloacid dehalogenase-like hydrolase domain-containing protein 3 isoform X2 [Conger conger]